MNVLKISLKIWKIELLNFTIKLFYTSEGTMLEPPLPSLGFRCKGNNSILKTTLFGWQNLIS